MFKVAIVTVSDKGSRGEREDAAGAVLTKVVREQGGDLVIRNASPWVHKVIDLVVQRESLVAQ
jgi:molybdopterin biosynthesis enzyme MoaB